jgi:hypothetical protein
MYLPSVCQFLSAIPTSLVVTVPTYRFRVYGQIRLFYTDILTVEGRVVALCGVVGATPVSGADSAHCVR